MTSVIVSKVRSDMNNRGLAVLECQIGAVLCPQAIEWNQTELYKKADRRIPWEKSCLDIEEI